MSAGSATGPLDAAAAHAGRVPRTDPTRATEQSTVIRDSLGDGPGALRQPTPALDARGDAEGAVEILLRLALAEPGSATTQLDLALALQRCGRIAEALAAVRRAVAVDPDLPQAWRVLGDLLLQAGDSRGAESAYTRHVQHSGRDPDLLAAAETLLANHIPEAEARLRAHLRLAPTDVAAIRMFAEVAARLGRHEDACRLLERCLDLAPGFRAARHNYALALHRCNRPQEALQQIGRLLSAEPGDPGARNLQAVVLCRTGDYEPAIRIYDGLLAEYPDNPRVWMSYGHALKTAGHLERAIVAYRRSLDMEPSLGEIWWSLANLKTFRFSVGDADAMQRQLARDDLDEEDRLHLEFALGKALEDAGRFESSFGHYRRGNAIRRGQLRYGAEDTHQRVRHIRAMYTSEFFAARQGSGCPARDPIFVVGLPRAGSTLIEQILSSHSQVEGTMELPEITSLTRMLRAQGDAGSAAPYHEALAALDAGALRKLGERYLEQTRIMRKTAAPLFVDKMPNNFMHIGLIHLILPNAKIIDARRHPMACCFSAFKQHFARGQSFSYGLEDLGRYYRDYVSLMAHFDRVLPGVLPGRVHRVIYERMVEDTVSEVRRLLAYCGLPFEPSCLQFFENARPVRTASSEQVRRPIYREGVDHWRHYAPWLAELEQALGSVVDSYPDPPEQDRLEDITT